MNSGEAAGPGPGLAGAMPAQPYPTRLIDRWRLGDGRRVTVRPVLPQDAPLEQSLVRKLSPDARYQRFFVPIRELPPELLAQLTQIDYARHVAIVAETFDDDGAAEVVGEARYVVDAEGRSAEFALVVADGWRRLGLASRLLAKIARHAARSGLARLHGEVLATNAGMLALLRKGGFERRRHPGDARLVEASLDLERACRELRQRQARRGAAPASVSLPLLPAL